MKRVLVLMLVGLVFVGIQPALGRAKKAPKKIERVVEDSYDLPSVMVRGEQPTASCGDPRVGCTQFKASGKERYVTFEVNDATGKQVYAYVEVNGELVDGFCGMVPVPIKIPANSEITVWVRIQTPFPGDCGTVTSLPTSGTVSATFSNIP